MKTGRNDTCPCGSGEKHKNCCLPKDADMRTGNRLFREMEAALMERMLPFADEVFGDQAISRALTLFLDNEDEVEFEAEDPLNPLFLPWFMFNWFLENGDELPSPEAPLNTTIAEAFLNAHGKSLSTETLELIRVSNRRPLSLYEILESKSGKGLKLFDLLLQQEIEVDEDSASSTLRKGEIIIASMVLPVDGRVRPLTIGPFALHASHKEEILDLRKELLETVQLKALSEAVLLEREAFVIGLYLDILDEMLDETEDEKPMI